MQAVHLAIRRCVKLEKSELYGPLGEGCVEVEHVVSAVVVMVVSAVIGSVSGVPDVCKLAHGLRLLLVDRLEEILIDRAAVASDSVMVKGKALGEKALVACHDVGEVSEGLRCVAFCSDVDVDIMNSFP